MNSGKAKRIVVCISLIVIVLLGLSSGVMAQEPRPTVPPASPPQPPTNPSPGGSESQSADVATTNCASLFGTAVNWGYENQGDVVLSLKNGSWQAEQVTSDDGKYNFGALGTGVGILNVKSGIDSLTPLINDAAVRLSCGYHTQANIGLYSGDERPVPPAQVQFSSVPDVVSAGSTTVVMLRVKNDLPDPISQAILTDLFPDGLTIEAVDASYGQVEVLNDRMLTVNMGSIPSGAEERIEVTLNIASDLSAGSKLSNTATLYYAESAADQDHFVFTIGEAGSIISTDGRQSVESGATMSTTADDTVLHIVNQGDTVYDVADQYGTTIEAIVSANEGIDPNKLAIGQELVVPTGPFELADTGASEETPPPGTLPVTGLGFSFSFVGLILIVFVLLGRGFRSINKR